MKKMKKLVGILLTLAMVVAMSVTAFAEETSSGYKIYTNSTGHTYEIYQIFTGTYSEKSNVKTLSDLKWGANSKRDANVNVGDAVAETVITLIEEGRIVI